MTQPDAIEEHAPTYRLNEYVKEARERMGERKWQKLFKEFDRDDER